MIRLLLALLLAPSASLLGAPVENRLLSSKSHLLSRRGAIASQLAGANEVEDDDPSSLDNRDFGKVSPAEARQPLPSELMPITMGVFSQMLGEGIAMSSLAFYLTRLGAEPLIVGMAISCFSVSQMTFAPIMVKLSSRIGCLLVLRICLAGAAASSLLIALSGSVYGVLAGRALAGVFAASVPVAQAGVTDILPRNQTSLGLSRVSAASQLGVVVGPAASAVFQAAFAAVGLPSERCLPAVFVTAALFAIGVLMQMAILDRRCRGGQPEAASSPAEVTSVSARADDELQPSSSSTEGEDAPVANPAANPAESDRSLVASVRMAQPMLRTVTIIIGWTAVLSNSIYGLFAPRFLGFGQPQLSATYSAAAALMIGTQMVFPRVVAKIGEHRACALGMLAAATGIGGQSLVRVQPIHSMLYMTNRIGAAMADTATAALVARSSEGREARSRNLALLTSTRAAARIASPILSSKMFALSCSSGSLAVLAPGALPFVTAACCGLAVAPLPMWLLGEEQRVTSRRD